MRLRELGVSTNDWFSHRRHRWHVPLLFDQPSPLLNPQATAECEKKAHLPYSETASRPAHTAAHWAALGTSVSAHSRSRLCRAQWVQALSASRSKHGPTFSVSIRPVGQSVSQSVSQ